MISDAGSFDYVIVGSGSAGSVLANRLSADPAIRVCLIEAGPVDRSPLIKIPAGIVFLRNHARFDWRYETVPQPAIGGRTIPVARGKTLGGSSSINSMVYIRGRPSDYDQWSKMGCEGWNWDAVLPFFIRSERNERLADSPFHGQSGPLHVEDQRSTDRLSDAFVEAAASLGHARNHDFNGERQEGFGYYQLTMHRGERWSTADAFLRPAQKRPNLVVHTNLEVKRLLFESRRIVAVEAYRGHHRVRFEVRREAILSAGVIGSPVVLMRSGIGPAEELERAGIEPRLDLPGVGRNLQEHPCVPVHYRGSRAGYAISLRSLPRLAAAPLHYFRYRTGMLSSNLVEAGGFFRSRPTLPEPDLQIHFIAGRVGDGARRLVLGHGFYADACVLKPKSRGRVWLERKGADIVPRIDFGMLSHADDEADLLLGLKELRRILKSGPLRDFGAKESLPGEGATSDAALIDYVRARAGPGYHPVGTCKMGLLADPLAVVDAELRVRCLENLRVVDASVMPEIPAGNTNAPTIMIAEKAADLIAKSR